MKNESPLFSLTLGTLHKELIKAREEAIIRAIDLKYGYFEWRMYSNTPNIQDLYGKVRQQDEATLIARITYSADFRGLQPLNGAVSTDFRLDSVSAANGAKRK